jgi:signal transduction histidine kinase
LCNRNENLKVNENDQFISVDRESLEKLIRMKSPINPNKLKNIFPNYDIFTNDSLIFPMFRKQEILGFIIIGKAEPEIPYEPQILNNIKYLIMQLSVTLNNLQMLEKMQDQQQLYAIGTYSSSILHNLKNPVDGLRMITEVLLNETKENDKNREYVEELYEGIMKLKKDLLNSFDFNKDNFYTKNEVDIKNILNEIKLNFLKLGYPEIKLTFKNKIGIISGNSEQISQALENLIENAMESTNYKLPVEIEAKRNEKFLNIEIKDQGLGIPVDKIKKLFNMFYSTKGEGRGLGLTISKNIIERHKGFLDLKSARNKGTTFNITLPVN